MKSIQTVDIATMKKGQLIKVPTERYGIAFIDDQLAVNGYGKIYIISKTSDLNKTLDVGGSTVYSLSVSQKNQLYYALADIGKSKLKYIELDETVTSVSDEDTQGMIGVKSDRIGNVYFLDTNTSNLKLFSFEDKSLKTVLTAKDKLSI